MLRSKIAGYVSSIFSFPQWMHQFIFHQQGIRVPLTPADPWQHLFSWWFACFLDVYHSDWDRMEFQCISCMAKDIGPFSSTYWPFVLLFRFVCSIHVPI
jgi:hypothetical protein